jgi:hypothetical protein
LRDRLTPQTDTQHPMNFYFVTHLGGRLVQRDSPGSTVGKRQLRARGSTGGIRQLREPYRQGWQRAQATQGRTRSCCRSLRAQDGLAGLGGRLVQRDSPKPATIPGQSHRLDFSLAPPARAEAPRAGAALGRIWFAARGKGHSPDGHGHAPRARCRPAKTRTPTRC